MITLFCCAQFFKFLSYYIQAGVDPGFLYRGFKFTKGGGFNLLNVPDCLLFFLIFLIFLKILLKNWIILSQRGVWANPLWIRHCKGRLNCAMLGAFTIIINSFLLKTFTNNLDPVQVQQNISCWDYKKKIMFNSLEHKISAAPKNQNGDK